jgi:hypothetical protein
VEFVVAQGTQSLRVDLALDSPFRFASPLPCEYAVQVNSYADLRVALNRAADLPDESERWPIKMLVELSPAELKQKFEQLAMDVMNQLREGGR